MARPPSSLRLAIGNWWHFYSAAPFNGWDLSTEIGARNTASAQFMRHWQQETEAGRTVPADWGRIVPPLSASTMKVFHLQMEDICLKPNFFPMPAPWIQAKGNE